MAELTLDDLLELLGHLHGFTSICHRPPGEAFSSQVVPSVTSGAVTAGLTGDIWFGVNPVCGPARINAGRGTAADVVRLAAVFADLDVKPGGVASLEAARDLIDELSVMLNSRPAAVVLSGHGMQPYWPIEDGPNGSEARALLRRWGRLVAHVAEIRGGHVDPVYDLARVLRVPGTVNYKYDPAVPVLGVPDRGRALTVEELGDALTAYGVVELPGDRAEPSQAVVSSPAGWQWAARTCRYATGMADGWASDAPAARHPWLVAQATRIAAGHRYGCYDATGYHGSVGLLVNRFRDLLMRGPEARKEVPGEIADALAWGRDLAGSKSDAQIAGELGGHGHPEDYEPDVTLKRGDGDRPFSPPVSASPADTNGVVTPLRRVRLTPASAIEVEQVVWTWQGRIPRGEITLTPGKGGIGKSTFHAWLIAQLTCGTLPGIHYGNPAPCIIAATEDSWSRTIVPRLMAAGANLDLVYQVDVVSMIEGEVLISLPKDLPELEQHIIDLGAALLSVDPLMGVISEHLDTHKDRDVRHALTPLAQLANRTQCTILGNAHFNKGTGSDPLALVMGSAGFGNVSRAVLGFARDPDADEDGTCVISLVKNNLGRLDLPSLAYCIENTFIPTRTGDTEVGRLVMTGESTRSVGDILATAASTTSSASLDKAGEWVKRYLEAQRLGYAAASEVTAAGAQAGYSEHVLKKARRHAGLRTMKARTRPGEGSGGWVWCLPGVEPAEDDNTQSNRACEGSEGRKEVTPFRRREGGDPFTPLDSSPPSGFSTSFLATDSNRAREGSEEYEESLPPRARPPSGPKCSTCDQALLLIRVGRTQCERCRLAGVIEGDAPDQNILF